MNRFTVAVATRRLIGQDIDFFKRTGMTDGRVILNSA